MNHLRVLLVVAMLLAFGAGAVLGLGRGRSASTREESTLSKELKLSVDQESRIRDIWSKMLEGGPRESHRRAALQSQRDEQISSLLTPEQEAKYEKIQQDYQSQVRSIESDRDAAFADAEAKTRALLTPEQAGKFDSMIHHGNHPHGMGPPPGPPAFMDDHHREHGPPPEFR